MTPKQLVINKRPAAFVHEWKGRFTVLCPRPGHEWKLETEIDRKIIAPYNQILGWGTTPAQAWSSAARALKGKRARRPQTRVDHRRFVNARSDAAKQRGQQRRELALRVGTFLLNEIEHGGQCSIADYRTVTPRWVLSRYQPRRRS